MLYSEYVDKFYKLQNGDIENHPSYIQYRYTPTREYKICAIIVKHVNTYPEIKIKDLIKSLYKKEQGKNIDNEQDNKIYKIDKYEDIIRELDYKMKTINNMVDNKVRIEEIMQLFSDEELDEIFNI